MYRILCLTIGFSLLIPMQVLSQLANPDRQLKIKVPTEWINQLRYLDFDQNNIELIKQFESFIAPDSLAGSKAFVHDEGGILNPMFVNLDKDTSTELIGLFGWSEEEPTLAVFKMIDTNWYLLYLEPFYMFYNSPELLVANNYSANKTFYIKWLYERGSGIYCDAYHFYKLIDNKVYPCLALINRAHIHGWGLYLNQMVEMKFNFNGATNDQLWVEYNYNFFPGAVSDTNLTWDGHEDISFVKGEAGLMYQWDTASLSYRPLLYKSPEDLNESKIACFGAFGNDSLFVNAFDYEIKQTLHEGSAGQKKMLAKYLELVRTEGKFIVPEGNLEKKTEIGKLKFYGTKDKK